MRSRITIEVRNTAEEKPTIEDAADDLVLAISEGVAFLMPWRNVAESPSEFPLWASRVLEPTPAYYSTAQRPPTEADSTAGAVLGYGNGIQTAKEWQTVGFDRVESSHILWPFWQPMPPAPEKQKTECEKAFEAKYASQVGSTKKDEALSFFQAGYEAARKETR